MNWAIGHGSSGGRCERSLGKKRMRALTSSLLHSQKIAKSSRSSSGVSKSEEKMVVEVSMTIVLSGAFAGRLRRWVFMAVLPLGKKVVFASRLLIKLGPLAQAPWQAGNRARHVRIVSNTH